MMENEKPANFMSIMLIIFTAIVCVMVMFALASSASILGQVIAFILALVAFLFFIGFAIYQLDRDNRQPE